MTETKFTPGPWDSTVALGFVHKREWPLVEVFRLTNPTDEQLEKETLKANANLIAAAPDLYEFAEKVLQELTEVLPAINDYMEHPLTASEVRLRHLYKEAVTLTVKARGEQNE